MKLQFDPNQAFQLDAVAAVTGLFEGQPQGAPEYAVIRAMADRKPERVACLDEGFAGNDQLRANAVQIFKTKGVFRTV